MIRRNGFSTFSFSQRQNHTMYEWDSVWFNMRQVDDLTKPHNFHIHSVRCWFSIFLLNVLSNLGRLNFCVNQIDSLLCLIDQRTFNESIFLENFYTPLRSIAPKVCICFQQSITSSSNITKLIERARGMSVSYCFGNIVWNATLHQINGYSLRLKCL